MAKFKVGDLVREKKHDLGCCTYNITNNKSICKVIGDDYLKYDLKVQVLECWNSGEIGNTFQVDPDRMEIIPQECPTIIKVSQTFTLQIKDITIDLDKSEIDKLKKQLGEV